MWRYVLIVVSVLVVMASFGCEGKKESLPTTNTGKISPAKPEPTADADKELLKTIKNTVTKGVEFLISKQQKDGSFGPSEHAVGITGLVISAIANCDNELREKYKNEISIGCKFLISKQQADGSIFDQNQGLIVYKTSVSIMALCNADKKTYADTIKKAVNYVVKSQYWSDIDASDVKYGGWGYDDKKNTPRADLSNTQFALEALNSYNLPKDDSVWEKSTKFIGRCQQWTETNDIKIPGVKILNDGGFTYGPADTRAQSKEKQIKDEEGNIIFPSYASMTYAGFKSLLYANVKKSDSRVQAAWRWIREHYTLEENYGMGSRQEPASSQQGLYYFYRSFGKALLIWGERCIIDTNNVKHDWCKELVDKLISLQKADGLWINEADRWFESMPELVTSYALDALNSARLQVENQK
ncbi:MAG: prenyltransferase/squalene oxidase repeat-containing protein [Planctomycetota bacterium]